MAWCFLRYINNKKTKKITDQDIADMILLNEITTRGESIYDNGGLAIKHVC